MKAFAYRIVKAQRAYHAFDGEGARLAGGRWNSEGTPIVYAACSRALAGLEMLVHLQSALLKMSYVVIETQFDSKRVQRICIEDLPTDWRNDQPILANKLIGDQWVKEAASAVLAVPSAIVPEELNYLINPRHPDFKKIKIGEPENFSFDARLIKD